LFNLLFADSLIPSRRSKRVTCYDNVAVGWLDVTRQYCIKTAKPVLELFRPPGSTIIVVYSDPCSDTQFQGKPLKRVL